jgi:acetyl esterase
VSYAEGVAEFVDRANEVLPPNFHTRPVPEQRALYDGLVDAFPFDRPDGVEVVDDAVTVDGHTVGLRVYRASSEPGQPAVLYFHGGGFVLGSIHTHDSIVAELAAKAGVTAIAVDFRPAPEHPFPAAVEDGWTALRGVVAEADRLGIDPDRIGVAGDSSGANLAVALCLVTRDRGGPRIAAQSLVSPVLDFARWRSGGEDAPLLSGDEMVFFTACYVGDRANVEHPYVSPLRSATFEDLPPAYVMAAELDSLRVDAEAYAERLRAEGTAVELVVEPGFVHACVRARGMSPQVADAVDRWCAATAALLAPEPAVVGGGRAG